ncbi:MAG: serine dehydratase [Microvirga sp.]|nr:serine dehydratase [Microvirga sp.]
MREFPARRGLQVEQLTQSSLSMRRRVRAVVAYSSGNHAQALAYAAQITKTGPLYVCLGGGGLLAGAALAAAELSPGCRIVGAEPEAGNDASSPWPRVKSSPSRSHIPSPTVRWSPTSVNTISRSSATRSMRSPLSAMRSS